jgi:hypothetical protein
MSSPCLLPQIGDYWSEPTVFSSDQSLGGATNAGEKGMKQWEREFADKYTSLCKFNAVIPYSHKAMFLRTTRGLAVEIAGDI